MAAPLKNQNAKKEPDQIRSKSILLRLTKSEFDQLQQNADKEDISVSSLIRKKLKLK